MISVLFLGVALFAFGTLFGASMRLRLALLGALWALVVLIHLTLPAGAELRRATGEDARPWLVLAAVALIIWGYRAGLGRLRAKAQSKAPTPAATGTFSDAELHRYARHMMLRELGGPGQKRLKEAKVLVIGAGGLGSPIMLYLAAAGVGTIGVIDDDAVDATNLQRQVIHTDQSIGMPKVFSAQQQVAALNPYVAFRPYHRRLTEADAAALFSEYDLVMDGTDNFDTRYLVNRVAVAQGMPLIAAALTQWEGQLSIYDPARGTPCFQCVFPKRPAPGLVPSCAEAGVVSALPGVMGTMMALEAIKLISGAGETLRGHLMIYDGLYAETRKMKITRRAGCPVCGD
ncbi:HesA/MoeB/ThiF family protein [Pararhodobacter oceanensis]|uniref:HesA/MoeB/ThiF family protein n=1 Tax=Pararhodobacter oceanensis TaxID=2172121 RepID=UPI003A8DFA01